MTYNEKLIGQWLEETSPKRAAIIRQYLLGENIRAWMRCSIDDRKEKFMRHLEGRTYRRFGLCPPIYSMVARPKPQPIHPVFLLGDSLNDLVSSTFIW